MRPLFIIALGLFIASPVFAAQDDVQNAARAFYDVYMEEHPLDIPNAEVRAKFDPAISPALIDLLKKADKAEEDYAAKTNNQYPPLVEGDLFTSNVEGTTSYSIGTCQQQQQTASCTVDLVYTDTAPREVETQTPPEPAKWQDTVFLVRASKGWKVDDIAYGATWEFGNHGKLKDVLVNAIHTAKEQKQE